MDISDIGKVLSIPSRVHILNALMGGQALPAGELAYRAKVSNQTMSEHLSMLEKSGLISVRKCGRHRYYELADESAALLLELLAEFAPGVPIERSPRIPPRMCNARFCYNHLAGRVGVAVTDRLVERGALKPHGREYELEEQGINMLAIIGVEVSRLGPRNQNVYARQCLDWSERRPHVAGAIGTALAQRFLELGWITRHRDDRSAIITELGQAEFRKWLDIDTKE